MAGNRKRIEEDAPEGAPEWMTTYSDLVTLLLCFFVLLFSMAVIDKQKFVDISFSLRSSLLHTSNGELLMENKGKEVAVLDTINPDDTGKSFIDNNKYYQEKIEQGSEEFIIDAAKEIKSKKLEKAKEDLEKAVQELGIDNFVTVIEEKDVVIIRFDSRVLFDSGSADMKKSGQDILLKMGELLKSLEHEILIQGHTDNIPINTLQFPSNWELSTKRSTNVTKFLIDKVELDPNILTPTGNAEFKPIASNDTPEGRQKNRRIDIVIERVK